MELEMEFADGTTQVNGIVPLCRWCKAKGNDKKATQRVNNGGVIMAACDDHAKKRAEPGG